jgi:hypothetical protein
MATQRASSSLSTGGHKRELVFLVYSPSVYVGTYTYEGKVRRRHNVSPIGLLGLPILDRDPSMATRDECNSESKNGKAQPGRRGEVNGG